MNNYQISEISAVIIVLNNVSNIGNCIESILAQGVSRVIIVDGGSTDGTVEIINKYPCDLYQIGKTGLAHSRQFGVNKVETKYVALVDSDNILDRNCFKKILNNFETEKFVGIAAQKKAYDNNSIYCQFQEWMNSQKINKYGLKKVIGTPAIYITNVLKNIINYDVEIKLGDDTDLCYRLSLKGYTVGTGDGICYEKMMDNFNEFRKKAYLYGRADCEFFLKHKARRHDIGTHAIRNYLIKMFFYSLRDKKIKFIPLIFLYSFSRFFGLYITLITNNFNFFLNVNNKNTIKN